jgi:hypothetical protein
VLAAGRGELDLLRGRLEDETLVALEAA